MFRLYHLALAALAAAAVAAPAFATATAHHSSSRPATTLGKAQRRVAHTAAAIPAAIPSAISAFERPATADDTLPARVRRTLARLPVGDVSGGLVRRIGPREQRLYAIASGTNLCLALYWNPKDLSGGYSAGCTTMDSFLANGFTGWAVLDSTHTLTYGLAPESASRFSATTDDGSTPLPVTDSGFATVVRGAPSRIAWQAANGQTQSVAMTVGAAR